MWKWKSCYAVLTDSTFIIYRNEERFTVYNDPSEVFDATQCKIRWSGIERSSKINCFEVFHGNSIVVFYHDEFKEANMWVMDVKEIERKHQSNHVLNFVKYSDEISKDIFERSIRRATLNEMRFDSYNNQVPSFVINAIKLIEGHMGFVGIHGRYVIVYRIIMHLY